MKYWCNVILLSLFDVNHNICYATGAQALLVRKP